MQPISSAGNHVTRVLLVCTIGLAALSTGVSSRVWAQTAAPSQVMTWKIDGETREAIVYAPVSAAGRMPLVFSFHGRGDNTEDFQYTDLHGAWPNAIVVYPQGLSTRGGLSGWQVERGESDDRDLQLVDAMLASLRNEGQHRCEPRPCHRLLERRDVHLPAVGGAPRRVCRLRPGRGPAVRRCSRSSPGRFCTWPASATRRSRFRTRKRRWRSRST